MKLASINLKSFRSASNLELGCPAPVIYVCGRNGAGKSSVREGIRWALRGVCSATDKKGSGWEVLIPGSRTMASAGVQIQYPFVASVLRTYENGQRALTLDGRQNEITLVQGAIYELMKTTPEFLDACLETSYFLDLHHAESKDFILGLLKIRIPYEGRELTLDEMDALHDRAFKERTGAKAILKTHKVPTIPVSSWGDAPPTVADIESKLAGLTEELRALERTADTSKGKREALQAQLEVVQHHIRRDQQQQAPDPGAVPRLQTRVDRLLYEIHKAQEKARKPVPVPAPEDRGNVAVVCDNLTAHKPSKGCVLDPGVECRTPKIIFTNRVKWYKEREAAEEAPEAPEKVSPEPQALTTALQAELVEVRAQLRDAMSQEASYKAGQESLELRKSEMEALQAQLASLPVGTMAADSTQIEALRARIAKGKIVLEAVKTYWRDLEAHTKGLQKQAQLQGEVERLEKLVADLGPGGLRVKALEQQVGSFEAEINQVTGAFGWNVSFQISPWDVLVNSRPLEAYSESERFRIGIGFQVAVAIVSGLKFMVVDRLDMLDAKNRAMVTKMLITLAGKELDQVVILSTREPEQALPDFPGVVQAYRLEKDERGNTDIVEQRG